MRSSEDCRGRIPDQYRTAICDADEQDMTWIIAHEGIALQERGGRVCPPCRLMDRSAVNLAQPNHVGALAPQCARENLTGELARGFIALTHRGEANSRTEAT
jgi:hypothetical protein